MTSTPTSEISQLVAMRLGVNYRGTVQCRGYSLSLRPLSMGETVRMAAEVADEIGRLPTSMRNSLSEHTLLAKKTLILASTSDVGEKDPTLTDYILDRMTPDEIQFLYKQWVDICDNVNPSLETMPEADIKQLVAQIKKKESRPTELSRSQLLSLVNSLVTNVE